MTSTPSQTLRRGEQRDRERASVEQLYQEVQFQDHWQVLSIDRGASSEMIKEAFFSGAKAYHPDRFRHITEPEFQEKLSFIFQRINEGVRNAFFERLHGALRVASS